MEKEDIYNSDTDRYFFRDGIKFSCMQCGVCCTGSPGIVRLNNEEVRVIAEFLNLTIDELSEKYLTHKRGAKAITELENGDCIFYDSGCRIYQVRPAQCRSFPFWLKNLRNEESWRKISESCPGIGRGKFFSFEEILELIDYSVK